MQASAMQHGAQAQRTARSAAQLIRASADPARPLPSRPQQHGGAVSPARSSASSLPSSAAAALTVEAPTAPTVPRPMTSVLQPEQTGLPSLGSPLNYLDAEQLFVRLLNTQDLDQQLQQDSALRDAYWSLRAAADRAIEVAFKSSADAGHGEKDVKAAHLFLHRLLYRINRMNLFWYDDLRNYSNERSVVLAELRDVIEQPWQAWELAQADTDRYRSMSPAEIKEALRGQAAHDVAPPELSPAARYIQDDLSHEGYRHLLAVTSVDGLIEASRQSRVCGGVANEIQCRIFLILMEEYGSGRLHKKHSTFFAQMMTELGLNTREEHYFDLVPWQSLAAMNHNFLLTERRRHYLRYAGGLTFFEVAGPSIYRVYLAAAQRLGLSDGAAGYWELHIREDERHGRQMVEDVALPLVDRYEDDAWEILLGYDQEKSMGERAGAALVEDLKTVDRQGRTPADDV